MGHTAGPESVNFRKVFKLGWHPQLSWNFETPLFSNHDQKAHFEQSVMKTFGLKVTENSWTMVQLSLWWYIWPPPIRVVVVEPIPWQSSCKLSPVHGAVRVVRPILGEHRVRVAPVWVTPAQRMEIRWCQHLQSIATTTTGIKIQDRKHMRCRFHYEQHYSNTLIWPGAQMWGSMSEAAALVRRPLSAWMVRVSIVSDIGACQPRIGAVAW